MQPFAYKIPFKLATLLKQFYKQFSVGNAGEIFSPSSSHRESRYEWGDACVSIFYCNFFFYFPTHNWFNNHLKHQGSKRLWVVIRPVWFWHHFHLVCQGFEPMTFKLWAVFATEWNTALQNRTKFRRICGRYNFTK